MGNYSSASIRFWIKPPEVDETISSVIERASRLYRQDSERIWDSLKELPSLNYSDADYDDPDRISFLALASALNIKPANLHRCRMPDTPWLIASGTRNVMCCRCWNESVLMDKPLIIMRQWSEIFRVNCHVHDLPLENFFKPWGSRPLGLIHELNLSSTEVELFSFINSFALRLWSAIHSKGEWPEAWGSPLQARNLLVFVSSNTHSFRAHP